MNSNSVVLTSQVIVEKYPPTKKTMLKWIIKQKIKSVKLLKYEEAAKWRDLENRIDEKFGKHFSEIAQKEYLKLYDGIENR